MNCKNLWNLGYVLGSLVGDGYMYKGQLYKKNGRKNGHTYEIILAVADRAYAKRFSVALKRFSGKTPSWLVTKQVLSSKIPRFKAYNGHCVVMYRVKIYGKQIYEFLKKFCLSFYRKKDVNKLVKFMELDET